MKVPKLLQIQRSLASRISMWVVLYVVVILCIFAFVGRYYIEKLIWEILEHGLLHAIAVRQLASVLTVLFVVMLIVLTSMLRRLIHRHIAPLTAFTEAVDEVAKGNLDAKLPVIKSKDEMRSLHHSFSVMQKSLVKQMEELKWFNEAKGRIEGELKAAKDIQQSMLPKAYHPADGDSLDVYGQQISAKEVGGDLYDFFVIDHLLYFCIGDVSGKGVPAALLMAMKLNQFRYVAHYETDVEKIINSINKASCEGNDSMMFITFFMGTLDLTTGHLHYCNAGHNKPFVVADAATELPADPDLPLGVDEGAVYVVRDYDLQPGDMLFLYTDGLTEAKNEAREMFGASRVIECLNSEADCKAQIEQMTQAVYQFVGSAPQSDDLTMLAIRYKNNNK